MGFYDVARLVLGWEVAECQRETEACVSAAAGIHPLLAGHPPEVVWSGFLSPGYEVPGAGALEAVLAETHGRGWGGTLEDCLFTSLTDARFYGLDYGIPAFCYGGTSQNAHAFTERVDWLRKLTRTVALFVAGRCGVAPR